MRFESETPSGGTRINEAALGPSTTAVTVYAIQTSPSRLNSRVDSSLVYAAGTRGAGADTQPPLLRR